MTLNMRDTIQATSSQLNTDDFRASPATVTVERVEKVTTEKGEPAFILHFREFPKRPLKPGKNVRRVITKAWGFDGSVWPGRRMTLYADPDVDFGKEKTGGIRVSHMSHLDAPFAMNLQERRGKYKQYSVQPLPADTPSHEVQPDWQALITEAGDDVKKLRAMWTDAQARGASEAILNDIKNAATTAQSKEN